MAVQLKVDNHTIRRERNGNENLYWMDGEEYKAFRADVPPQIVEALNLSEINFQSQHDAPFWFNLTPGELARELNKIVDLEVIDQVMSSLASRIRKAKAEREVVEERLAEAKAEQKRLFFVPSLESDLSGLEKHRDKTASLAARRDAVAHLVSLAVEHKRTRERALRVLRRGMVARDAGEKVWQVSMRLVNLNSTISQVKDAEDKAHRKVPDLSLLIQSKGCYQRAWDRNVELGTMLGSARLLADTYHQNCERLNKAREQLKRETGGRCPVCGGELKDG